MDDFSRLLRLLSLVFWSEGSQVGLRFDSTADQEAWDRQADAELDWLRIVPGNEDAGRDFGVAFHELGSWYAGAVEHHLAPNDEDDTDDQPRRDARGLPTLVVETLHMLPAEFRPVLARIIIGSLELHRADPERVLARWLEDVEATAWRVLVDRREDADFTAPR
ncbi:hypothetical protein ACFXGA_38675 [Actinosynnema sp. NPDC059335]|uniref:hypothetical protein n=1 Tax=Actinosynnema sp. NPDC059335 TaxID=3346804 RepID=UPI00366F5FF0